MSSSWVGRCFVRLMFLGLMSVIGRTLLEGACGVEDPLFVTFEWRVGRVCPSTDVYRVSIVALLRCPCPESATN